MQSRMYTVTCDSHGSFGTARLTYNRRMLYLTPNSIGYLAQGMMALAISVYLRASRPKDGGAYRQTHDLLTALYGTMTLVVLTLLLDSALDSSTRLIFAYAQNSAVALLLLFALQFAYRFPAAWGGRREPRLVLVLSTIYLLFEASLAIDRYRLLAQGLVRFRPELADLPLVLGFLWLLGVVLRQAGRLIRAEQGALQPVRRGWQLRDPVTRTAFAYVLVYSIPLWLSLSNLLSSYTWLSTDTNDLLIALGILGGIFFHALIYFNLAPVPTPLPVRLAGVALLTILLVFGGIGWVLRPAIIASYRGEPHLPENRALRFTPRPQGGYQVEVLPPATIRTTGARFADNRLHGMPFAFPFFGASYRSIFVHEDGIASFGRAADLLSLRWRYGTTPAIAPLFMDLNIPAQGGIFIDAQAEYYRIAWYDLYSGYDSRRHYTFQLELWPSGTFILTYAALPAETIFSPYDDAAMIRFSGALAGDGRQPASVDLLRDLPRTIPPAQGVVASHYFAFRAALNRLLLPLAMALVASSLLVMFGIPLFIAFTVTRPLQGLLSGVRGIERGQPVAALTIYQADEIGTLTRSFNAMNSSLQHAEADLSAYREHLEELVEQRTRELGAALVDAEAASRTKSTFLTTMSHDLRTPLTAIIGLSETLIEQARLTHDQQQDLMTIGKSGAYLLALINDVLTMARLETGHVAVRPQSFDLFHMLHEVEALVRPQAQRMGLSLRCEFDPQLPRFLYGDALKIRQVLINLLNNAIKFTDRGWVRFTVKRLTDAHTSSTVPLMDLIMLRFAVADSGIGIAPQSLAEIFEPFVRVGGEEVVREGTGLGLSISQEMVRLLGGKLLVESQPGHGSCFFFRLAMMESGEVDGHAPASLPALASRDLPDFDQRMAEQWRSCPSHWQTDLSYAVRLGDFVEAERLITTLPGSVPELAAYLANLIARFDQHGVLALIDTDRLHRPDSAGHAP